MKSKNRTPVNLTAVGETLVEHSRRVDLASKRGLVVELFPFIYEASARMSARAISRFLWEKQKIKISAVSIAKAISDPKRYWNKYFDVIEPFARIFEKGSFVPSVAVFLYDDKKFDEMTEELPIRAYKGHWLDLKALRRITVEDVQAANILREKWRKISMDIRLKARPFIEHRLGGKERQK